MGKLMKKKMRVKIPLMAIFHSECKPGLYNLVVGLVKKGSNRLAIRLLESQTMEKVSRIHLSEKSQIKIA